MIRGNSDGTCGRSHLGKDTKFKEGPNPWSDHRWWDLLRAQRKSCNLVRGGMCLWTGDHLNEGALIHGPTKDFRTKFNCVDNVYAWEAIITCVVVEWRFRDPYTFTREVEVKVKCYLRSASSEFGVGRDRQRKRRQRIIDSRWLFMHLHLEDRIYIPTVLKRRVLTTQQIVESMQAATKGIGWYIA